MSNLIRISRVIITQPSTTGRPCPNTLIEIKPCESTPCYKWIKTPWKCDLQVGSYFISVILHKPFLVVLRENATTNILVFCFRSFF